jgi:hypothetical protein
MGEVLADLKAAHGKHQRLIANQEGEGLNYPLLEADSYLQGAIEALTRAMSAGAEKK